MTPRNAGKANSVAAVLLTRLDKPSVSAATWRVITRQEKRGGVCLTERYNLV
jgi:hypothetical protein